MTIEGRLMRILFDGYWWSRGPAANRTVQREFITAWHRNFPDDELIVALRGDRSPSALPDGISAVRVRLWPQAVSNALELPLLARRHRVDAIVCHNFAPIRGTSVTFIHDLMFQEHPEWFSRGERAYFALMPLLAPRATVIATSSHTEARRITTHNPRIREVVTVGLAVGEPLREATPVRPDVAAGLTAFALSVGRLNARKNLAAAIEAAAAASVVDSEHPLLLVGGNEHSGVSARLTPAARDAVARGEARFIGSVSDAELAWLYANSSLVVNLSHDEGFGLPPLEAAHFGAPLLVSDIPVFREIVGTVAHFIRPDSSVSELGEAVDAAWSRPGPIDSYDALRRRYTWSHAVQALRATLTQ